MNSDPPASPRFIVSVTETLMVVTILTGFCAFLLPGVETARKAQRLPPVLPQLQPLHEDHPWLFLIGSPIVVTTFVGGLLAIARVFLPRAVRAHFVWKKAPRDAVG